MKNISKVFGLIGLAKRAGKLSMGSDSTREALSRGRVNLLILAGDAAVGSVKKLEKVAREKSVPVIRLSTKTDLGGLLGREKVAVLGVVDESFAKGLIKLFAR